MSTLYVHLAAAVEWLDLAEECSRDAHALLVPDVPETVVCQAIALLRQAGEARVSSAVEVRAAWATIEPSAPPRATVVTARLTPGRL